MKNSLLLLQKSLFSLLKQHPKSITTAVTLLLLGGGGGAFAVATLTPGSANVPVHEVLESVQPLSIQPQMELLDQHSFTLSRSDVIRSSDTVESLLQRMGVVDPDAAAFLRTNSSTRLALLGHAGRTVSAEVNDRHELESLTVRWINSDQDTDFQRLVVTKSGKHYQSRLEVAPLEASTRLAGGVVRSSLYAATDDARIPDSVSAQMTDIFSGNIDFHRALHKGDRFSVTYETLEADGEPLRAGRVLSVEFVNAGKVYQALWFQEPGHKGAYYNMQGESLRRAYLAAPVAFSRITSGFAMRLHPIFQTWHAHVGTDYAAPTGTPVSSVGDGVVEFAGVQNGYGNVVYVKHNDKHTTVYAHLSRIAVRQGQAVTQGATLGAVGSTGWATGPHLHFEFRVNGHHQDPMLMARENETVPVSAAAKAAFARAADSTRISLAAAHTIVESNAD